MVRAFLTSAAIFIAAFFVYGSNGDQYIYSYDSAPNSLLVFNLIENHRLDFDNFAGGYFQQLGAGYIFTPNAGGHAQSIFPIGAAIVSAPVYLALDALAHAEHQPLPIATIAFERQRLYDEKTAASAVAAVAAVLMFWCVCELGSPAVAAVLTLVFAFGTSMWTIGSQALWQHGSVNLLVVALTWALVRGARTAGSARSVAFALGGLAAGSLTVVRPTALLFALAALAWMLRTQRRDAGVFTLALLAGAAPGVIWNLINFHSLAGGYAGDAAGYRISPDVLAAWLALAISPSKGLVWYLPFVVLAPLGAVLAARSARTGNALLAWLGAAGALLAASYGFYAQWWGGASFGPRFLTDLDAVVVLLLVPLANPLLTQLRARHPAALAATALFAVVTAYAIGVQVAGANGESPSEWSAIPRSLDTHPARMWATTDTQIGRDARFAYARYVATPAAAPRYASSFAARVDALAGGTTLRDAHPGRPLDIAVTLHDTGRVPLYGYTTGVWTGQARVAVQLRDASGAPAGTATLYVAGTIPVGSSGMAYGTIVAPSAPGTYELTCAVYPNRVAAEAPAPIVTRFAFIVHATPSSP